MSWLQFFDSMTGHLAWPLVALLMIYLLRRQLAALTERVLELSFGGATVKFGALLTQGTDIIDKSEKKPTTDDSIEHSFKLGDQMSEVIKERERTLKKTIERQEAAMDALSYSLASDADDKNTRLVFGAFEAVENTLADVGAAIGVKAGGLTLMRALERRDLVTADMVELYRNLRTAKNAMAHGEANLPNDAEALEYLRQATFLIFRLGQVQKATRGLEPGETKK